MTKTQSHLRTKEGMKWTKHVMAWLQGDCFFLYIGNGLPILLSLTHVFYPHRVQNYHAFVSHWSPRVVQEARSTVTKKHSHQMSIVCFDTRKHQNFESKLPFLKLKEEVRETPFFAFRSWKTLMSRGWNFNGWQQKRAGGFEYVG